MTVIYLPVEVVKREFWAKAILASYLVDNGHKVYIFQDYLFDKHGYPEAGFYIGKNLFKTWGKCKLDHKLKVINDGIKMYFLEEEALGFGASHVQAIKGYFESRFGSLTYVREAICHLHGDRFLAWSKLYADQVKDFLPESMINITGSPLFASCKPEWKEIYKFFAPAVEQPYVLACSSYSLSNSISINAQLEMAHQQFPEQYSSAHTEMLLLTQVDAINFAIAIKKIAGKTRNIPFVFRPHPSENCDIYNELFADAPNVLVSNTGSIQECLSNTHTLIHSGCSTAIQARIMGVSVITLNLRPDKFLNYPYRLFNLGYKCTEWELACVYLNETGNMIQNYESEFEQHIDTNNSFERIVDLIDSDSAIPLLSISSNYNVRRYIKDNFRKLRLKIFDLNKPNKSTSDLSGWSSEEFNRFAKAVKFISQQKFGKDICSQQLTSNCFIFFNPLK